MNASGEESKVIHHKDGTTILVGPDATAMAKAYFLWSAIGLWLEGISPTRGATRDSLLTMATSFTKKEYTRSRAGLKQARIDVKTWADEMQAALPHEVKE